MKYFTLAIIILLNACNNAGPGKLKQHYTKPAITTVAECNYASRKIRCKKLLTGLRTNRMYDTGTITRFITDSLLSCWYGTRWDYNGCTTIPGEGKIACGYFITTTLQDAGLTINRIKMAQCPSSQLIRSVCSGIRIYSNTSIEDFVNDIKKSGDGLYIAGLDFHTGFIYYDGHEVYFIHSSFYGTKCVVKEKAIECAVLKNSKLKMTGRINFN